MSLEALLHASPLRDGTIQLSAINGRWTASVAHRHGHMTHAMGAWSDDPVEALRVILVEDERRGRELGDPAVRDGEQSDIEDFLRSVCEPEAGPVDPFEDMFG